MMKLSITAKFYSTVLIAAIGYIALSAVALYSAYDNKMEMKKDKVESLVDTAYHISKDYYDEAKKGELTEDEAKNLALKGIMSMRYEGNNYLWVHDMDVKMVAHALKPELNGQDLSKFEDPFGTKLFVKMVDAVKANGSGHVHYFWERDKTEGPIEKVSYVRGLKEWGWVIGTGIYIDDVKKSFYGDLLKVSIVTIIFLIILAVVATMVANNVTKPLKTITGNMKKIISGNLDFQAEEFVRDDEIGVLSQSLKVFLEQAHEKEVIERQRLENQAMVDQEKAQMEEERKESVMQLAAHFESSVKSIVEQVSSALHELNAQANVSNQSAQEGANKTQEATQLVNEMSDSVERVTDVTNIISSIADQTNLLALNAAIESARAGEAGRGFAVVADEVRKLASQTVEATVSITEQINAMEVSAKHSVQGIEVVDEIIKANGVGATEMLQAISDLTDQFEILDREASNFLEGLRHS